MQITNPLPTAAELWDWRANVDSGKIVFAAKRKSSRKYPNQVRTSLGFEALMSLTNEWRESSGLPPLAEIRVPDFGSYPVLEPDGKRVSRDTLVEDTVRGFNGHVKASVRNADGIAGQFELPWHEFWLKTQKVQIPNRGVSEVLVIENEQRDDNHEGRLVGDAIWARIPTRLRPITGDPNYVENVRRKSPTCP